MTVHWSSFIADDDGDINYALVRQFIVLLMGLVGGILLITTGFIELLHLVPDARTDHLAMISAALITPVTGGYAIDKIKGKTDQMTSEAIVAGKAPSRRAADTAETPALKP